jgi:hypothetical protein
MWLGATYVDTPGVFRFAGGAMVVTTVMRLVTTVMRLVVS